MSGIGGESAVRSVQSASRATLTDVAARVGVSPRTVSRVVNGETGFSEATRLRVLEAVTELNYRPNLLARGLIRQTTDTFGFVITMIDDPFFPDLALGVQTAGLQHGRTMFFAVTNRDHQVEVDVLHSMMAHSIAGAIVFSETEDQSSLLEFANQGLRIVLVDDFLDHPNVCSVSSDLYDGARRVAEHFVAIGRSKPAILATSSPVRKQRRRRGFVTALNQHGIDPIVVDVDLTLEAGRVATEQLLDQYPEIDAIFAHNDLMAVGALKAVQDSGRRVPDDIAVAGCDGILLTEHVAPPLTTINIDRELLGRTAVESLITLTAGTNPGPINLPVELIERGSSV